MPRVRVYPADHDGACSHYRLRWPAEALAKQGADVIIDTVGPKVGWDRVWSGTDAPLDAQVLAVARPDADIVVIQRPGRRHWSQVIPHLQADGVRVVVDVDDGFAHIPRENVAWGSYQPRLSPLHNWAWIDRACAMADLVTCTTPALARHYGRHGRVAVLPNLVPESYLTLERDPLPQHVGWTGTVETHPHDLESTGGTVQQALDGSGWRFHVVGTGVGVQERLRLRERPSRTGWVAFEDYPHEYARLDIAVVPLHPGTFNTQKSGLKASEAAALGVVPVMSPTPDNIRLHKLGVGVLAPKPRDWGRQLTRLMADGTLRADLAGKGREVMASQTYEARSYLWAEAWESALTAKAAA